MKISTLAVYTILPSASAFSPIGGSAKTTKTHAVSTGSDLNDGSKVQTKQAIFDPLRLYPKNSLERRLGLIESLESSLAKDQVVTDPLSLYQDKSELTKNVVMSASLPFLRRPKLLDGSIPGDLGFDPFNFASDTESLTRYRDSETKHGRLAMLAAVGWPIAELTHKTIASQFHLKPILGIHDKVPSVLNGGLEKTNPFFWISAISAAAALEFIAKKNGDTREPGDFGFDPLSISGNSDEQKFFMKEAEVFNGRLAMLAITGFVAQEFYSTMSIINQSPDFFKPFDYYINHFTPI